MSSHLAPDRRTRFTEALGAALTDGIAPAPDTGLGPRTMAAIAAVAADHPEAAPAASTAAYDAFRTEHH
jgi:hypothetical protein